MSHGKGLIKGIFERNCGDLVFDKKLAKKIKDFQIGFVNKNEEHMVFFGGNLTGVQVVRFTSQDRDKWFGEIIQADDVSLEDELLKLPIINPNWHVATDIFNHSCLWLIHRFLTSDLLTEKERHAAALDCALVLYYRFLTSLLFRYFRYPADARTAQATYAQLSYKFAIKKYGSWYATLEARSENLIEPNSLHSNTFKEFTQDLDIVYLVNDSQGRIRDMLKNIYSVFKSTHTQGIKIKTTSSVAEHDGEQILKDKTKNLSNYTRYLHSVISDKDSFIKEELTDLIVKIMHTMPPKLFIDTLEWCSVNYKYASDKNVETLVDETLTHSFQYLTNNRNILKDNTDLAGLLSKLRGVYMSSRSTDEDLIKIRRLSEKIIKQATNSKSENAIASVRTGLMLYIVIRAFTMNYYSR